jgi:lipoprotein-releasing system permease protein
VNLEFYIAKHYLLSKKSTNIINLISAISIIGLTIGTAALVIILSIFNGLEDLIISRYNSFDPDLKVLPQKGKTISTDSTLLIKIKHIKGIKEIVPVLEENVLVKYGKSYHPARIKGVTENFLLTSHLDTMLTNGDFILYQNNIPVALVGQNIANTLNISINYIEPMVIFAPKRTKRVNINPEKAFIRKSIYAAGTFSVEPEIDNYIVVPFDFASKLLQYKNQISALEIYTQNNANQKRIINELKKLLPQVNILDRLQQHKFVYKILKSEKMITYLILTLIIILASFTLIGSLSMLIIEKKEDIKTLLSLGMTTEKIKKIFITEGMSITILGAISGIILGLILVWLQQKYGLIKLYSSDGNGNYIVDYYPVKIIASDLFIIFTTVFVIGFLASKYPPKFIVKKYFVNE